MTFNILFLYTLNSNWLALNRQQREEFNATVVRPIVKRYSPRVSTRFCDAEAFTARCSDFAIFETDDLPSFYFMFEALRDTPLFSAPYLVVNDLIVGVRDGHDTYNTLVEEAV